MMDDYGFDYFDEADALDMAGNNYWDLSPGQGYDQVPFYDTENPFWQSQSGVELSDYMNFNDPFGSYGDFSSTPQLADVGGFSGSSSGGPLSNVSGFLKGLVTGEGGGDLASILHNLGAIGGGAYDLYNGYNQNQQGLDSMKLQNQITQAALKSNANNDYRAFTNDAGGYTNDALTSSMIAPRYDLLTSLMANDKNLALSQGDRGRISSAFGDITDRYTPVYEGYANDMVNRRNAEYAAPYNSNAPFPEQMGIPAGTSPEMINQYLQALGVA